MTDNPDSQASPKKLTDMVFTKEVLDLLQKQLLRDFDYLLEQAVDSPCRRVHCIKCRTLQLALLVMHDQCTVCYPDLDDD